MKDLQEFQRAAVSRIVERLRDENGSGRFLLADEVGLGKTMVARGVINGFADELRKKRRGRKGPVYVYLCSSLEIAEQNRTKLSESGDGSPTRLTLIPKQASVIESRRGEGDCQLFLFTPGTSLKVDETIGTKLERQLLLAILVTHYGKQIHPTKQWVEFFRGAASPEAWKTACTPPSLRAIGTRVSDDLRERILLKWERMKIRLTPSKDASNVEIPLLDALFDTVAAIRADGGIDRTRRRILIGQLRKGLAMAALDFLAPDLILVDEFQRFRDVIDLTGSKDDLANRLFHRRKTLILSATPYKAFTRDDDTEEHYLEFQRTLAFLLGERQDKEQWLDGVQKSLNSFRRLLTADTPDFPGLLEAKSRIEQRLKEVMCRTERNRYLLDEKKGIEEVPDFSRAPDLPALDATALTEYLQLKDFLDSIDPNGQPVANVIDYWKSSASMITFMDGGYKLHSRLSNQVIPEELLSRETELGQLADKNLKMKSLVGKLRTSGDPGGDSKRPWKFLWVKPTYCYFRDEFFGESDPHKFLIFSRWRFVPKAVSFVVSSEFERGVQPGASDKSQLLGISAEMLKVCMPFLFLADLVDISAWSAGQHKACGNGQAPSVADLRKLVKRKLRQVLKEAGIQLIRGQKKKSFWPVLFQLEQRHLGADGYAFLKQVSDELASAQAEDLANRIDGWLDADSADTFPEERLDDVVNMAIASPAIALARTLTALFGEDLRHQHDQLCTLCLRSLRTYFNKDYVGSTIRRHARTGRYADQVLRYCLDAHLQAVLDEYGYLMHSVLQRKQPGQAIAHFKRVLGLGAANPRLNVRDARSSKIRNKRSQRSVNFAMAFGEEIKGEESNAQTADRKTAVREAFNSPFWPFVLATTSVGQEGLDFHLYCRDVMHWNLPANPVDLEQREGRINRFDGLVVRRNIRIDYSLADVSASAGGRNLWHALFEHVCQYPKGKQKYKHGLFPHWVFEPTSESEAPCRLRRHVAFFDGSRDKLHYQRLKRYLSYYRLAFGQARQQDLLDQVIDRPDEPRLRDQLQACMINLSPFEASHPWDSAMVEAGELAGQPVRLNKLIDETRRLVDEEPTLHAVRSEIEPLWRACKDLAEGRASRAPVAITGVAALIYLLNPYDEQFDGGFRGFDDDLEKVRQIVGNLSRRS